MSPPEMLINKVRELFDLLGLLNAGDETVSGRGAGSSSSTDGSTKYRGILLLSHEFVHATSHLQHLLKSLQYHLTSETIHLHS